MNKHPTLPAWAIDAVKAVEDHGEELDEIGRSIHAAIMKAVEADLEHHFAESKAGLQAHGQAEALHPGTISDPHAGFSPESSCEDPKA